MAKQLHRYCDQGNAIHESNVRALWRYKGFRDQKRPSPGICNEVSLTDDIERHISGYRTSQGVRRKYHVRGNHVNRDYDTEKKGQYVSRGCRGDRYIILARLHMHRRCL